VLIQTKIEIANASIKTRDSNKGFPIDPLQGGEASGSRKRLLAGIKRLRADFPHPIGRKRGVLGHGKRRLVGSSSLLVSTPSLGRDALGL